MMRWVSVLLLLFLGLASEARGADFFLQSRTGTSGALTTVKVPGGNGKVWVLDASGNLIPATIGSGLTLASGVLTASAGIDPLVELGNDGAGNGRIGLWDAADGEFKSFRYLDGVGFEFSGAMTLGSSLTVNGGAILNGPVAVTASGTQPGLRLGVVAGVPTSGFLDGQIWYNSSAGQTQARISGVTRTLVHSGTIHIGLEIGSTDATIDRVSAGIISVEGVPVPTISSTHTLTNKTLTSPVLVTPVLGTPTSGNFSTGTFTWPTFNQSTTGSAATLTTSRTINGVGFNGSANITVPAALATLTGGGNHKIVYLNGSGVPTELALGASGTVLQSNGATAAPSFVTPSGGGGLTNGDKGDITVSGGGATLSIDNRAVTYAKMPSVAAGRLLGRRSSSLGDAEEITIGDRLTMSGTELNVVSSLATQVWVNSQLVPILDTLVPTPYIDGVYPGSDSVTLNWSSEAGAWNVYRNDVSDSFATAAFLATTSSPEYIDEGLSAETTYYYFITTTNEYGLEGAPAATGGVTTGSDDPSYAPPFAITITEIGTNMVFDWEEESEGPEIKIYRRTTYSSAASLVTTVEAGNFTYTKTSEAAYYFMTSSDVGGYFESEESDITIFPPVPVGPDVAVGNFNGLGLPVFIGPFDSSEYEVVLYRDNVPILYGASAEDTVTDEFVPSLGDTYSYKTGLRDSSGNFDGELSAISVKTITSADAHFGWTVNAADEDSVSFSGISPPLGNCYWEIWYYEATTPEEASNSGATVTTSATVSGLNADTEYLFWLVLKADIDSEIVAEGEPLIQSTSPEP